MRLFGRTLSTRLIAVMALLLTLASVAVGFATYEKLHKSLMDAAGEQLQTATDLWHGCVNLADNPSPHGSGPPGSHPDGGTATGDLSHCPGQETGTYEALQSGTTVTAYSLFGRSKTNVTGSNRQALLSLPICTVRQQNQPGQGNGQPGYGDEYGQPTPSAAPQSYGTSYTETISGTTYLVSKIKLADTGQVLITGIPLTNTLNEIRSVLVAMVSVFAGVLVLAIGVGIVLVRLTLRPLRRVATTATKVTQLPLDSGEVSLPPGVPDTDPHTEVGQVGAAFNRMLGHVERALSRRAASESRLRRFAADASHELRTPLSAIRGYAELALRHPGPVPEEVAHALSRVQSESARMSVLVDDLLLLARLDAGRPLEQGPVDLSRLAIDATSDAQVARRDHRWRLELPDDPVLVTGDEHRLHQVVANLLSNAGKHTPAGTTVTVTLAVGPGAPPGVAGTVVRGTVPAGPVAELSVTDDGPGIPAELLPELFERFTRADTSRFRDGDSAGTSTGLGLAIVDAVVSAHGGAVTVASHPGHTRFALLLPLLPEPATPMITGRSRH